MVNSNDREEIKEGLHRTIKELEIVLEELKQRYGADLPLMQNSAGEPLALPVLIALTNAYAELAKLI